MSSEDKLGFLILLNFKEIVPDRKNVCGNINNT